LENKTFVSIKNNKKYGGVPFTKNEKVGLGDTVAFGKNDYKVTGIVNLPAGFRGYTRTIVLAE